MENGRHKLWYSIISYIPDLIAYERINIGAVMGNPETGKVIYRILQSTNKKLRYFLKDDIEKKMYKVSIDYLDFLLKRVETQPNLFQISQLNNVKNWTELLGGDVPDNIVFSKIHFAKTANDMNVFNNLLSTYVGDMFLPKPEDNIVTLKQHVFNLLDSKKLIGTKIKSNLKIKPASELPLKFEMDYTYLTKGNEVSFIQLGPKQSQINEWYKNNVTLLSKNSDNFSLNMLIKENDYEKPNQTFKPFLRDLASDKRVSSTIVTNKDSLSELVKNANNAISISKWDTKDINYIA